MKHFCNFSSYLNIINKNYLEFYYFGFNLLVNKIYSSNYSYLLHCCRLKYFFNDGISYYYFKGEFGFNCLRIALIIANIIIMRLY